ncbi:MAG: metal ABC transporter substrate-binding protein [Acidimicrobiales bacterium]
MTARRAHATWAALAAVLATGLAGCGTRVEAKALPPNRAIDVVVSAYPLAQLTSYIGGRDVQVDDLAPPGSAPENLKLTQLQLKEVARAPLLVDVGDGYQPQVEAAPTRHRLSLLPAVSGEAQPYQFWLDPALMGRAADVLAQALAKADPAGRAQFYNGARDFRSVVSSLESDYQSGFSTCNTTDFVTADNAFERMARSYDLVDIAVDSTGTQEAAALVKKYAIPVVFAETGAPAGAVQRVATEAGVPLKTLDPMEVAPKAKALASQSYFTTMEDNLSTIEEALSCDTSANY